MSTHTFIALQAADSQEEYSADVEQSSDDTEDYDSTRYCVPNMDLKPTPVTSSFQEQELKVRVHTITYDY